MTTIENIIYELIKAGINISSVYIKDDNLAYEIQGFSKSGTGLLYTTREGKLNLETRYNRVDIIETLEDVVDIAYDWDKSYSNSINYPNINFITENNPWYDLYKKYNLI